MGGVNYGIVQSVKLSTSKRPVSEAPASHGLFTQRSMGNKGLTPIEIEVALSGGRMNLLYRFAATLDDNTTSGTVTRFDGEIAVGNARGNCVQRQRFYNGLVTSFTFGDLDVTSTAPAPFKVTIEPERIETIDGDQASIGPPADAASNVPLASRFRVSAQGLTTSHVTKVYGWTTKRTTSKQYVGEQDLPELIPGSFEFPKDAKIAILAGTADDWRAWHRQMVIDGDFLAEKDIVVEYLDTRAKNTLLTVTYHKCGITHVAPGSADNQAKSASTTATLYCNRISVA